MPFDESIDHIAQIEDCLQLSAFSCILAASKYGPLVSYELSSTGQSLACPLNNHWESISECLVELESVLLDDSNGTNVNMLKLKTRAHSVCAAATVHVPHSISQREIESQIFVSLTFQFIIHGLS